MTKCKEHSFFSMTGRCFGCGKHDPSKNLYQRAEYKTKRKPGVKFPETKSLFGVFKIRRLVADQGSWEVRKPEWKESKWLSYKFRADAQKRCDKMNGIIK